ncbi:MAG: hypothetical protein ACI4SS_01590 [Clostridia bacterium]
MKNKGRKRAAARTGAVKIKNLNIGTEPIGEVSVKNGAGEILVGGLKPLKVTVVKGASGRNLVRERSILQGFAASMKKDMEIRRKLNAPSAKFDVATGRAYLEYPDGRVVYADET